MNQKGRVKTLLYICFAFIVSLSLALSCVALFVLLRDIKSKDGENGAHLYRGDTEVGLQVSDTTTPVKDLNDVITQKKTLYPLPLSGFFAVLALFEVIKFVYSWYYNMKYSVFCYRKIQNEYVYIEKPGRSNDDVDFEKVIGMDDAKKAVLRFLAILVNKKIFKKFNVNTNVNILLAGSPGLGKTMFAKAVSRVLDYNFYDRAASEFVGKAIGEGARRIREFFEVASLNAPSVIFIDEIDSIGLNRDSSLGSDDPTLLTQLLVLLDGTKKNEDMLCMAGTNLIDRLDSALVRTGRFSLIIRMTYPTLEDRIKLFDLYLTSRGLSEILINKEMHEQKKENFIGFCPLLKKGVNSYGNDVSIPISPVCLFLSVISTKFSGADAATAIENAARRYNPTENLDEIKVIDIIIEEISTVIKNKQFTMARGPDIQKSPKEDTRKQHPSRDFSGSENYAISYKVNQFGRKYYLNHKNKSTNDFNQDIFAFVKRRIPNDINIRGPNKDYKKIQFDRDTATTGYIKLEQKRKGSTNVVELHDMKTKMGMFVCGALFEHVVLKEVSIISFSVYQDDLQMNTLDDYYQFLKIAHEMNSIITDKYCIDYSSSIRSVRNRYTNAPEIEEEDDD